MQELQRSEFERVKPLFNHILYHRPVIFTVLEGTQPGRVFVDRVKDPTAALIISDFCYFNGSPASLDFQPDVVDLLASEAMPKRDYILLFPFNEAWHAALPSIFQAFETKWYERTTFELDTQRYRELHTGWKARIPAGFTLQRLNSETASEVGGIPELWGDMENFLAHGFGFCLIDQAQLDIKKGFASSAQTVFVGDRRAETGVGTREVYRRRGLATSVCCAYIDHCLENNIIPDWGCVLNEASEKLADKMGYGSKHTWPFLYVRTPEKLRRGEMNPAQ